MERSSSTSTNINSGVTFRNKTCFCGKKAGLKISESKNNPDANHGNMCTWKNAQVGVHSMWLKDDDAS
ncbi:hypothetical protein Dsin_000985 [Dipteronia sinensis]|uniref:Uncharacterized protein n=1 Tax=Dipteronia sinensis TaxID=43782 RepID=A0AAE0EIB0_9ROSI|nr:hypothetical protein Dsin_000985 [Dipteronia sinensis]